MRITVKKQEIVVKHVCPLNVNVTVTLTFDLEPPNSIGVIYYHNTKLEDPWAMSSLVIDRTSFVYGPTDGQVQNNTCIPPLLRRVGGGCIIIYHTFFNFK